MMTSAEKAAYCLLHGAEVIAIGTETKKQANGLLDMGRLLLCTYVNDAKNELLG